MSSGYTRCGCRDCFEIAVSDDDTSPDLCGECEDAGCQNVRDVTEHDRVDADGLPLGHQWECQCVDAYEEE